MHLERAPTETYQQLAFRPRAIMRITSPKLVRIKLHGVPMALKLTYLRDRLLQYANMDHLAAVRRKKVVNVMGDGGDSYGTSGRKARKSGDARTLAKGHGSFYAPFFLIQQGNSGSRKK
jgi:hypothetical protein